jgi:hypothetical protein
LIDLSAEISQELSRRSSSSPRRSPYLDLKTRDKRFDRSVTVAIHEGRAVEAELVGKMIGRLSDNNLRLRGDTIGLEETRTALFSVRDNAVRQQIDGGKIAAQDVTKKWKHSGSEHPRIRHIAMNNQETALDMPFAAPDGTLC